MNGAARQALVVRTAREHNMTLRQIARHTAAGTGNEPDGFVGHGGRKQSLGSSGIATPHKLQGCG